jgi:hypothetical protein
MTLVRIVAHGTAEGLIPSAGIVVLRGDAAVPQSSIVAMKFAERHSGALGQASPSPDCL